MPAFISDHFLSCAKMLAAKITYSKSTALQKISYLVKVISRYIFSSTEPKAHRSAYSIPMLRRPSVRRRRPSAFTISKIFFSETAWPIKLKFYMEPPWVGGMKVCSQELDRMTKMAAAPIYGKNPFKNLLLQNR